MNKKIIAIVISALVLVGAITTGVIYVNQPKNEVVETQQNTTNNKPTSTWENSVLTYNGQDGITAGELIAQVATIKKDSYGMVASINGLEPDSKKNQYWQFLVNGVSSTVGADTYVTKSTDIITWEITSF